MEPPEELAAGSANAVAGAAPDGGPAPPVERRELTEEELLAGLRAPRPSAMDPTGEWSSSRERESHPMSTGAALLTVGAVAFGLSYLVPVVVVGVWGDANPDLDPAWGWAALPIAGPFIANGTADPGHAGSVLLIMDGIVQTAGAVLLVVGGTSMALESDDLAGASLTVVPLMAGPGAPGHGPQVVGLGLLGQF